MNEAENELADYDSQDEETGFNNGKKFEGNEIKPLILISKLQNSHTHLY
jgi:hypothetical protein